MPNSPHHGSNQRLGRPIASSAANSWWATSATSSLFFNIAIIVAGGIFIYFIITTGLELQKVPNLSFLENYQPTGYMQIFDRKETLICQIEDIEKRKIIPLSQVTPHLQRAVLSAEDHHFYEHHGIDPLGIVRAGLFNLISRHGRQGGSTVTQQLTKNLFFEDSPRNLTTKLAEAIVSLQMENHFSKEKILELYLNEVYFGNGAYGIEQAANIYFDKDAADLTIAESAYIAGLIRWPSRGGNPACARENVARQHDVIDKMREYSYIDSSQQNIARSQKLIFRRRPARKITSPIPVYPYYISYVLDLVRSSYSEGQIQRHGLKVYTNLDRLAQTAAEHALEQGIRVAPPGVTQGALVSINVRDGAVLALVGGVGNYMKNQWNCATNPHTMGSVFKPFVYLSAFISGKLTPSSMISDSPVVIPQDGEPEYKPKNFDDKYMGDITVSEALAYSRNTCAIRAAQLTGIESIINTARLAGIRTSIPFRISTALGCSAASPMEVAGAFSTLARGGTYIKPRVIRRIEDKNGNLLQSFYSGPMTVFDKQPVSDIVDILQEVVEQGTGTQAKLLDRPVAGKTGTSDQARDLWFAGFTPDLSTAVWGGNNDNKPIYGSHTTGGTVMARIWREYNRAYYAEHNVPSSWFVACSHLSGSSRFPRRDSHPEAATALTTAPIPLPESFTQSAGPTPVPIAVPAGSHHQKSPARAPSSKPAPRPGRGVVDYSWSH